MSQPTIVTRSAACLYQSNGRLGRTKALRKLFPIALTLFGISSNTHAQRGIEISPIIGGRTGGKIDVSSQGIPNTDYFKIRNSWNFGVIADISFWEKFHGEFMWNRQPTSLTAHNPNDGTFAYLSKMNLDMYLFSGLYQFRKAETKVRPFVVVGFGFSHFGIPSASGQAPLGFTNRPAFNIGGGVKYYFTRNFGIRSEIRWSPSRTTPRSDICYYGYSIPGTGYPCVLSNTARQEQANIGLIFRFK